MSHGGSPVGNASATSATNDPGTSLGSVLHDMVRQGRAFSGHERNCSFLNLGSGKFADVSSISGFDFPDDGRSVATCDWDGDGDLDFWIANRSGPQVRFMENKLATNNHFVEIKLSGKTCNRDAIGARVEVLLNDEAKTKLIKTLRAGEGFLTQSSKLLHFGLGAADKIADVVVHWPGGKQEHFGSREVDHQFKLVQGSGKAVQLDSVRAEVELRAVELKPLKRTNVSSIVSGAHLPVPRLSYQDVNGESKVLEPDGNQGYLLVNLWASWCRPCLVELKEFAKHADELRSARIKVAALSVDRIDTQDSGGEKVAVKLMNSTKVPGVSGWATGETVETLRLMQEQLFDLHQRMSLPTSLLIDPQGRLAVLYRGPVEVDRLIQDVAELRKSRSESGLPFAGRWRVENTQLSPFDLAWDLVNNGHLNQVIDYISNNYDLLESHYNMPKLLTLVGNAELGRGNAKQAVSYYESALKLDRSYTDAQNNLAWILSTHPDESLRNGTFALRLAESALKRGRGNAISMLDTLAAALAENGKFTQAIKAAEKARDLAEQAGQLEQAKRIEGRLELYKAQQPYRSR